MFKKQFSILVFILGLVLSSESAFADVEHYGKIVKSVRINLSELGTIHEFITAMVSDPGSWGIPHCRNALLDRTDFQVLQLQGYNLEAISGVADPIVIKQYLGNAHSLRTTTLEYLEYDLHLEMKFKRNNGNDEAGNEKDLKATCRVSKDTAKNFLNKL